MKVGVDSIVSGMWGGGGVTETKESMKDFRVDHLIAHQNLSPVVMIAHVRQSSEVQLSVQACNGRLKRNEVIVTLISQFLTTVYIMQEYRTKTTELELRQESNSLTSASPENKVQGGCVAVSHLTNILQCDGCYTHVFLFILFFLPQ